MVKYDINDPYDLDTMQSEFDFIKVEEWDEYIEIAKEHKLGFKNIGNLMDARKKAGLSKYFSDKKIQWALSTIQQIEEIISDEKKDEATAELIESGNFDLPPSHLTLRVAWHDNKWDGSVCKDPAGNNYCSGFNSLLSERIRRRKAEKMDLEVKHKGCSLNEINYLPPCFWSVNLFGKQEIGVEHDNPAAPSLNPIQEKVPQKSILSWPFAISFTRTRKELDESGAYPKNLSDIRIPRFNAKVHEGKSVAFMYAKFSNPLTEEEQQYLVVGAGIVDNKQKASDIPHFGPANEIEKIKQRSQSNYKYRNFPSINWAMRFGFDDYSMVRMPYHEYLEESEKVDEESRATFFDKIKVAITEPELEWCFKYVAMDIGDDEAIYILTKMRKALISSRDEGVVPVDIMQESIDKIEGMLHMVWESRSYFPGFPNISRVLLNQQNEPKFALDDFYTDFKEQSENQETELIAILNDPTSNVLSKGYVSQINELRDRLDQWGYSIEQFLFLSLLNLKPFQFQRILDGKLGLTGDWIRNFEDDVKRSHHSTDIIDNPYLLYEDYDYWPDSHDDVYGEELDSPIELFKIDIAFFPDSRFASRNNLQRQMSFKDKRRIRALVLRHLNTLENTGDCFVDAEHLEKELAKYPLFYEADADYKLPDRFFHPIDADCANHFQNHENKLVLLEANETMYYYLSEVYNAEKNIEAKFNTLLCADDNSEQFPGLDFYINDSIQTLTGKIGKSFDDEGFTIEREQLYRNLFAKKLFVVTGNAGSGKSYEILKIISHLEQKENQKYLLLAPTGKAALRLSSDKDFKNIEAFTIDKFIADYRNRKISQAQLKTYKNIIIDEASMVDLLKMKGLLSIFNFKEPSFKRLILIGDPNQLPAIGYGRVLADLISYLQFNPKFKDNYIQLETNCRSELKDNKVLDLAEAFKQKGELLQNIANKIASKTENISDNFRIRYWDDKEELYSQIKYEFLKLSKEETKDGSLSEKLNQLIGLQPDGEIVGGNDEGIENFQIISPYRSQYSGTSSINDFIQTEFKEDYKLEYRKNLYKKSDKLIRTKNYYDNKKLLLSNGTLGIIKDEKNERFYFESEKGMDKISFYDIRKFEQEFFELAYAISVHKSQGSGFNHLFIILPFRYGLLSKELVYTALTRTKKSVAIFLQNNQEGKKNVLEIAMGRTFSAARRTSLMLDKPYRHYDLEPEPGVFIESRIELHIYHLLMKKLEELGEDIFRFDYEVKPIINGKEVNIKTDFTVYVNNKIWYWEHLGLLNQRKYKWTWLNLKKKTYKEAGIWDTLITTDETMGINPTKIEEIIDLIISDKIETEDKFNQYSNHHYYFR